MASGYYGVSRRLLFDSISPANASDLLRPEIENLLPKTFRHVTSQSSSDLFVKVHDDARRTEDGDWLYPPDCVRAVIYLVRHPYDVTVSCAHHLGLTLEEMVNLMADDAIVSHFENSLPLSLPQHVGSWSSNASSWLGPTPYAVSFARYEDLHLDPVGSFRRLARAAGFQVADPEIANAVEATQFDSLRRQEQESGFRERPPTSSTFFREGRPRTWEGVLSQELRDKLARDHSVMMEKLGYAADGSILPLPDATATSRA